MKILKETKLNEGLRILGYEVKGNYTLILFDENYFDYSIKEINKILQQYKSKAVKVSGGFIKVPTETLVNFAIDNLR